MKSRRQDGQPPTPLQVEGADEGEPSANEATKAFTDVTLLINLLIFTVTEIPILVVGVLPALLGPDGVDEHKCHFVVSLVMNEFLLPALLVSSSYTTICYLAMSEPYRKTLYLLTSEKVRYVREKYVLLTNEFSDR